MDSDTDQELPPVQPKQKLKKRYVPPQPDKNTFASQQEFLDSLDQSVVPISSLQSDNLKCPHCWKIYGESDPDTDNAERPLKFRCGHVFGDACMKELFRLPQSVKMELEPLEFSLKKSREFAQSIERYVLSRWDKNTPPTSEAVVEIFTDLLAANPKEHQPGCLANDWMKPIREKFEPTSMDAILKVYFSKNGVVIDIERTNFFPFHVEMQPPHKVLSAPGHPHSFSELLAKTSLGDSNTPLPSLDSLAAYYGINSIPSAGVVPQVVPMPPLEIGMPSQSNTPFTDAIKGGPSQPNTPFTDAIKVGLPQSNTPFADAIKEAKADILKKEPEDAKVQAAKEKIRKKRRQAVQKCRENSRLAVARALAEVYEAFQEYKPQHLISESQSKPLKIARTRNISRTNRILHAKDLKSTSPAYVVEAPLVVGITYEIDSEAEPANQEPAAVPTHDPNINPDSLDPFLILSRQLCQCAKCYPTSKARDAAKSAMIASTPVSVTWSHNKDLPNSCPLCSRILFLRGFEDRGVLGGDWSEVWTSTHGEINLDGHHSA